MIVTIAGPHCLRSAVPKEGQISAQLDCRFLADLCDSRSAATYEICHGTCAHTDGWAPACHVNCFRLTEGRFQECLEITTYTFDPTLPKQQRRHRWLLESLASRWEADKTDATKELRRLPPELRWRIAEQLLREYATARLSVFKSVDDGRAVEFSISAKVWARFVFVEGVRYITSLLNVPSSDEDLVYVPIPQRAIDTLYVCEDQLGIRQVVFANSEETQRFSERPGVWWRSCKVSNTTHLFKAHTDVSYIYYGLIEPS